MLRIYIINRSPGHTDPGALELLEPRSKALKPYSLPRPKLTETKGGEFRVYRASIGIL